MTTYTSILNNLKNYQQQAAKINQNLNAKIEQNNKTFKSEFAVQANTKDTQVANAKLNQIQQAAQKELDSGIAAVQDGLNVRFFGTLDTNTAAELDSLDKSDLTQAELQGYANKFQSNAPAMRRLETIAKNKGFLILGPTFDGLSNDLTTFKQRAQELVTHLSASSGTGQVTATIAANLLADQAARADLRQQQTSYAVQTMTQA